jgi:hypothetical protein
VVYAVTIPITETFVALISKSRRVSGTTGAGDVFVADGNGVSVGSKVLVAVGKEVLVAVGSGWDVLVGGMEVSAAGVRTSAIWVSTAILVNVDWA